MSPYVGMNVGLFMYVCIYLPLPFLLRFGAWPFETSRTAFVRCSLGGATADWAVQVVFRLLRGLTSKTLQAKTAAKRRWRFILFSVSLFLLFLILSYLLSKLVLVQSPSFSLLLLILFQKVFKPQPSAFSTYNTHIERVRERERARTCVCVCARVLLLETKLI